MATYKHLRSSTANKRPTTSITDGQLAINTNTASPGLFFKDSAGTGIVKVGPVHVGTTAPNATPAAGGSSGNYLGEQWLDTSVSPAQMKVWNGSAWVGIVADELPVSKLQDGDARQLLQTDAAGTGVEWTSNVDVPGTLDVTGATTLDSTLTVPLGSAASPTLRFSGDANSGLYSPGADQVAVATNGTGRLFVDASGNVGVGLTPASYAGYSVIGHGSTTGATLEQRVNGSLVGSLTTDSQITLKASTAIPIVFGTNNTERLRITSAGLVGIGVSAPGTALEVNGTIRSGTGSGATLAAGSIDVGKDIGLADGQGIVLGAARRISISSTGTTTLNAAAATAPFIANIGASEAARIDSSGRLLVGTSTARGNFFNTSYTPQLQLEGVGQQQSMLSVVNSVGADGGSVLALGKQRSGSIGGNTILQSGDQIGELTYQGSDGTELVAAASIAAYVDGTPGANDMPGRIILSTTADGASSPTERMRINNNGTLSAFASIGDAIIGATGSAAGSVATVFGLNHSATSTTTGTTCLYVLTNGDVRNTNNSYGAISDIKLKENIVDANSQWDDIKSFKVRKYNFKREANQQTHTQIGLVAQEAELVSPGLVSASPDRDAEGNDLGTVTKSVNYSVLYMKAVKALQEAMERIEVLEQRLNDAGIN